MRAKSQTHIGYIVPDDVKRVLDEHGYDAIKQIGKGGFADCYLIHSRQYEQKFCCKVISLKNLNEKGKKQSFHNEYEALIRANECHIIQLYKHFICNDKAYIILEYCPNGDLFQYVQKNGPVRKENEIYSLLTNMLSPLVYLESKNTAHGDIKPSNFLIDHWGRIKLTDFGLAQVVTNKNYLSYSFAGSLNYVSPEIAFAKPFDPFKSDVWAFGVMLYFMTTGAFPFKATSIQEMRKVLQTTMVCFPRSMNSLVKQVIMKCLQVKPELRPSFSELYNLVESLFGCAGSTDTKMFMTPFARPRQQLKIKSLCYPKLPNQSPSRMRRTSRRNTF